MDAKEWAAAFNGTPGTTIYFTKDAVPLELLEALRAYMHELVAMGGESGELSRLWAQVLQANFVRISC